MDPQMDVTVLLDQDHMGPAVDLPTGSKFPRWLEAWVTVDGVPVTLELLVEDGRPELIHVAVARPESGGKRRPITASLVHGLPLEAIVQKVVDSVAQHMLRLEGRDALASHGAQRARRRRSMTPELLQEVADAVLSDPLGMPNQAVQRRLPCSSRTASRYITAARQAGYLPPIQKEDT